jgi:O-antigen/teichoic acid export membrane protein
VPTSSGRTVLSPVKDTVQATTAAPAGSEPAHAQMRSRVISGSAWTLIGFGASQVLRLVGNVIFARLLYPEALGLMLLVNTFVQGLTMFSDIGVGPSIIQSPRGEERGFLNTAWSIQITRGFLLWIVSLVGAAPFARWYGEPQLASLIPIAALSSIISGFNSTKLFTANRSIAIGRITVIEFVSAAVGIGAMVAFCLVLHDVWGIVYGSLAGVLSKAVLSHVALPGEVNRVTYDRRAAKELFGFGRWIFISSALTFLAVQVDRLMLGQFVPIGPLGVYGLAAGLATLTPTIAGSLAARVLFPLLAHHSRTDSQAYKQALYSARAIILQGALFLLGGLALLSPTFFRVFYQTRYGEAGWMAQLLTVPMWFWMLMLSADRAVLAVGESRTLAIANACSLAGKILACAVGFHFGGLGGFILGLGVGNLVGHIPIMIALRRHDVFIFKQDMAYSGIALALLGGGVALQRLAAARMGASWLTPIELSVAAAVLVPIGIQVVRHARQAMARK